ncbi:MAG: TraB/GumN family protein [Chitinophagaceae bacterium]|nr:TraB/GumN family protein [Chitinophagaceae bacterium]
MLRKNLSLLTFILVFSQIVSFGQEKALLWEITGKGLKKPSYIFGTIHLICKPDYVWSEKMTRAFDATDKICLEMDLDDMNVMMEVSTGLMDNTGKKLSSYFCKSDYARLKAYMKDSAGMDISMFEMMKPVAIQTMMVTKSTSCDDAASYEDSLMKTAKSQGKELLGLESAKEQLAALESIPVDSVIEGIMDVVNGKDSGEGEAEYRKLVAAYRDQDIALMQKLIVESDGLGGNAKTLVDDRNAKWIPLMGTMMKDNSVFFAVGAGHLAGKNGVISLLRAGGYTVKAVK